MTNLALLGATGSIGRSTLKVVDSFSKRFQVKALTAKSNIPLLVQQIEQYRPDLVAVYDETAAGQLKAQLPQGSTVEIVYGPQGYCEAAVWQKVDLVVGAMVGAAGLEPTLAAIDAGKDIALANKETLVMAGELVTERAAKKGIRLLPIDSEHSAIFQCMQGHRRQDLDKIILTASGGPFRDTPYEAFSKITPERALKHPNWEMGAKITIDSATLMNKGLEVIEAKWLFGLKPDQIEVMVHPQSIIHSMVAYCDGSIIAQLGIPDMQEAIAYALAYPERLPLRQPLPDLVEMGALTFEAPDFHRFSCLGLAFEALSAGGSLPAVMNAANEVAVNAFLDKRLDFKGIPRLIAGTMAAHATHQKPGLNDLIAADDWARRTTQSMVADAALMD